MNGPQHYEEAENLIDDAWQVRIDSDMEGSRMRLAAAQVHATLALAAALGTLDAFQGPISGYSLARSDSDSAAWQAVTGTTDD